MEHKYAEVNGVKLHYVCSGSGKLMLFLHGFPEFWYEWKNQLAEFGQDHFAVAPDMRGYNLSDKPESLADYQVDVLVDDVKALADHLGYSKLTLIAHDWGGAIAWVFALKYPNYLDKLVVINAPHPIVFQRELLENAAQQEASQYMLVFRSEVAESMLSSENYALLVQNTLSEGLEKGFFTEEDKQAYLTAWSQPGALTGGLNYYRAAEVGPPTNEEDKSRLTAFSANFPDPIIQVPTLVIWGEKDPYLLPGNLEGLSDYVPNLTIKRIEDGSHWVVHEQPKLVNQYIREFI